MTPSFADAPGSPRSDRTRPSTRSVNLSRRSLLRASFALGGAGALAGLSGCGLAGQSSAPIDSQTSQASQASQASQSGGSGARRVIGLYATDADNALVLGLPLVGSWSSDGRGFPAYQAARLQGVTPFSTDPQPDLDTITSLEPDLILGVDPDYYEADLLATLAKIAELDDGKTPDGDTSWQAVLRGVADRRGGGWTRPRCLSPTTSSA